MLVCETSEILDLLELVDDLEKDRDELTLDSLEMEDAYRDMATKWGAWRPKGNDSK